MVIFMCIGVQTFKLFPIVIALLAKEEVIAIFTHPTILKDLSLAAEALIPFVVLHL
jgi:hypothetical protein